MLNVNSIKSFFKAYPSLKPHILLYSNGLAIWHGLPDISYIKIKKTILAERYLGKKVGDNSQKAHLHPLRNVCLQYESYSPETEMWIDGWLDIWGDAINGGLKLKKKH